LILPTSAGVVVRLDDNSSRDAAGSIGKSSFSGARAPPAGARAILSWVVLKSIGANGRPALMLDARMN